MDKRELQKMYEETQAELKQERAKLSEMYEQRMADGKPLTDKDLLKQNDSCGGLSLELKRLREMLEETED